MFQKILDLWTKMWDRVMNPAPYLDEVMEEKAPVLQDKPVSVVTVKPMGIALITRVKAGKNQGKYRFLLTAMNGASLASSGSDYYDVKNDVYQLLWTWFPRFEIVDKTV